MAARQVWITLIAMAMMVMEVPAATQAASSFVLKWSPQAKSDGLQAFEGVEDDTQHTDPGVEHIYVQGNNYRFDMPLKQRDRRPHRQRNEVRGMVSNNQRVNILEGETWRLCHRIFIPKSLQATTSYTHIMQLMSPSPVLFLSLRYRSGLPTIELGPLRDNNNTFLLANAPLAPLQDKWIQSQLTFTAAKEHGSVEWVLTDVASGAVVKQAHGYGNLFRKFRVHPKWGIYRAIYDTAHLETCYMLITNFKAWKLE